MGGVAFKAPCPRAAGRALPPAWGGSGGVGEVGVLTSHLAPGGRSRSGAGGGTAGSWRRGGEGELCRGGPERGGCVRGGRARRLGSHICNFVVLMNAPFLSPPLSLPMLSGGKGKRVVGSARVAVGERGMKEGSGNKNNDCEEENALRTSPSPHAQKGRVRVCVCVFSSFLALFLTPVPAPRGRGSASPRAKRPRNFVRTKMVGARGVPRGGRPPARAPLRRWRRRRRVSNPRPRALRPPPLAAAAEAEGGGGVRAEGGGGGGGARLNGTYLSGRRAEADGWMEAAL